MNKKVYHLSHIDLDGYSCQLISKRVFENIEFFNSNYGDEILERLTQIINGIKDDGEFEKYMILITDLNLSMEEANFLEESLKKVSKNVEILLLDHHKSGLEVSKKFDWYFLDVNRSATKITYDYFKSSGKIDELEKYVDFVNAYDIWLQDERENFEIGKVLARYVLSAKELNRVMFADESFCYIENLLEEGMKLSLEENAHIVLDDRLHFLKKGFFKREKNDTLENLVSEYVVELLSKKKEKMSVYYKGKKGILTYSVGNTSIIGNNFLVKNPEFDFFLDITGRKTIGMRANNKVDVSQIAKEVFEGGGHANASGGKFAEFKDSFIYEKIKEQIDKKFAT